MISKGFRFFSKSENEKHDPNFYDRLRRAYERANPDIVEGFVSIKFTEEYKRFRQKLLRNLGSL